MSLTSKQKSEVLESLHRFFNLTDEYPAEPGRSLEFSEQIKSDMTEIIRDGLHKNITNWGKRCSEAREARGYKQEQVANFLNVNHRSIQRQEGKNAPSAIDPFYLEAFSLVYNTSPYELLGLKGNHLFCPILSLDDQPFKFSDIIITTLFDANDPDKLAYLATITKIGKLKLEKYRQLISILEETTAISQVFEIDPLDKLSEDHNKWRDKRIPLLLYPEKCDPNEYSQRHIFWDACLVLDDLEQHDPMRLRTLAQLALCDVKSAKALRSLVLDIGYPKDARSLRNYPVEKLLAPPKKQRKRKSTSVSDNSAKYPHNSNSQAAIEPIGLNTEIQNIVFYCPNRSLTGILEDGQVLVHNGSSHSSIHGHAARLTEFLLTLNYTKESQPAADNTMQEDEKKPEDSTLKIEDIYRINLHDSQIYSNEGTATLTEVQAQQLQQIIKSVFSEGVYKDTLPLFQKRQYPLHRPESNV